MALSQYVFENEGKFYLVDIYRDGRVYLKIKEDGWGDVWSLPIPQVESQTIVRTDKEVI